MKDHEFYRFDPEAPKDMWGEKPSSLDTELLGRLARGPIPGDDDLESAQSLARMTHQQYEMYGTSGGQDWVDAHSAVGLQSLRLVLERHGITFSPPWRDFPSFRSYWKSHGCTNSYQARRDVLEEFFGPVFDALNELVADQYRHGLATGVSPRPKTGWARVDDEVEKLRQRFRTAESMQDYRDVGNRSVAVLEALSDVVYDHAKHGQSGQPEPPVDKTDIRIGAYIADRLSGASNEELRGLTKKCSAFAHKTKHSPRADRTHAGIAADAVIMLANILRRLAD